MSILQSIKNFFSKALRFVGAMLKAVFTSAFKILMAKLSDVATSTITKLATTDLSGDEKRKQAFKDIKAAALEKMLTFTDSDINLIIEVFHKALKEQGVID